MSYYVVVTMQGLIITTSDLRLGKAVSGPHSFDEARYITVELRNNRVPARRSSSRKGTKERIIITE